MTLRRYVARRLLQFVPVLLFMATLNFVIVHIAPGDPAVALGGENATREQLESIRTKYGLDQPLHLQFWRYMRRVVAGDLGFSYAYGESVLSVILSKLPATALLIVTSAVFAIGGGVLAGTYAARHQGSPADRLLSGVTLVAYSTPVFWVGLVLVIVFGVRLRWLPTSGMMSLLEPTEGVGRLLDIARHLILPVVALNAYFLPIFFRLVRASVIEVLNEDYIVTARAIGLPESRVFYRHALRNALQPVVTMAGLWLGVAFTGSVLVETVFGWPGMGRVLLQSIFHRDYPMLMGIFFFTGTTVIVAGLVTDLVNALLDPRVVYS